MKNRLLLTSILFCFVSCADYSQLNDTNPPASVTLSVADVHDSTVTLRWTQSPDDNFKSYKVYVDSSDIVDPSSSLVDSLLFAMDTIKIVRGLKPATTYHFRVFVINQAGKISASNIASAITWLSFLPQQKVGDSMVILNWTKIRNSPVAGYRIFSDTTQSVDTIDQVAGSDTSLAVKNIPAGQINYYRAYARDDSGFIAPSNVISIAGWWFLQKAPQKAADTAVSLSWALPKGSSSFRVFRASVSPVDTLDTLCVTASGSDTSATVGNLIKGSTWFFKVYARNASGYFAWTNEVSIGL
jgi:hypothetical protein